jgi:hypothetical protein
VIRDVLAEIWLDIPVAEACLAHSIGNKTKAAYLRTDFSASGTLMQRWADHGLPPARIMAMPAQPVATIQQAPMPSVPVRNAAALPALRRHAYRWRCVGHAFAGCSRSWRLAGGAVEDLSAAFGHQSAERHFGKIPITI